MLSYTKALAILEANVRPFAPETVGTHDASGWTAATALDCDIAVPAFDNSAMDGFALRAEDTRAASPDRPARLRVSGTVLAGDSRAADAVPGGVHEIMTGAPVPAGYDTVVPIERVEVERDSSGGPVAIAIAHPCAANANLRRSGEDFPAGTRLLNPGDRIGPNQIMALAATGIQRVSARRRPVAVAITTGNELSDAEALPRGMIHDANGPYLGAALRPHGADCKGVYRTGDSAEELVARIESVQDEVDVVVTTGGVSAGRMDFVPRALESMGADILFHRVAIRPGKPALFARLPDGTWFFGLPGNPIAVAVGLRFFVAPALRLLQGTPSERFCTARLTETVRKKAGLTFFAKGRAYTTEDGVLEAEVLPGQESFKIRPLLSANCWVVVPEEFDEVSAGSPVAIADMWADRAFM